ncbi:hypothetical protein VDGD_03055 [Verticillium dahliae]|nr:hypothetical protein VDGD_03055 [Verticillium dahliae]
MARASARIKAQPAVEPKQEPETPSPRIAKTAASAKTAANAKAKAAKAKASPQKPAPKRKAQKDEDASCDSCAEKDESSDDDEKPAKRRKTTAAPKSAAAAKPAAAAKGGKAAKAKPAADDMPLAARTAVTSLKHAMYIGAHVSGAGGVQNAIGNASSIGANAFALFLKSQRKWASPPLAADARAQFVSLAASHGYDAAAHVLPHGSYLVNLAQADGAKAEQAYGCFVDDLARCDALGVRLYNLHPGNTGGAPRAAACARIAAQLNRAHAATAAVVTVLENMAGAGNVVGTRFEDLRDVIALVDDKERVGVCIDTCHAFAAGYDMRTPAAFAATMAAFDDIVGLRYLKALHLNDSKAPFDSHRDLHANIGTGFLGLRAFHSVVNYAPLAGLPMVLETPIDRKGPDGKSVEDRQVWADEIKLLESLIGMDAESDAFAALERELQDRGAAERQKIQDQVDKKTAKETKKAAPKKTAAKPRGRKKKEETDDESD